MGVYQEEFMYTIDDIVKKLELLDIFCGIRKTKGQLILFGGSAILIRLELENFSFRPTKDIDVGILKSMDEKELVQAIREANIDLIVGTIEVPPPEDFRDMEKYKLETNTLDNIEVFVPSFELLACTKLFSKRQKDLDDLEQTDLLNVCNKEALLELVEDYKGYVVNPEHPDWNYKKIDDIFSVRSI
ncbi:DUF6036 family nucleotidyltransferase [Lysinibacillus capsici]|uniref:DUF6036 family nucleotidyltransferase n=1 Tax=Lysinibacillus capsici TaxID=2115968 RepID=UPI002E233A8E|nr:DUF6036 family nucleotidyltransferase [Lysinibacillus capsici]